MVGSNWESLKLLFCELILLFKVESGLLDINEEIEKRL